MLSVFVIFFFFNDTATTEIYTLSLHDALPISSCALCARGGRRAAFSPFLLLDRVEDDVDVFGAHHGRVLGVLSLDVAGLRRTRVAVLVQPGDDGHHAFELGALKHHVGIGHLEGLGEFRVVDPDGGEGSRRPARPFDDHEEYIGGGYLGDQRRVDRDNPRDRTGGFLAPAQDALPGRDAGKQEDPGEGKRYELLLVHDGIITDVVSRDNVFTCVPACGKMRTFTVAVMRRKR